MILKSKEMKKNKNIPKKKTDVCSYVFFIILVVVIPNVFFTLALDWQLEIRMLTLSIFLGLLLIPIIFKEYL